MTTYYLDFETDTGDRDRPNPELDTIVTIQFQPFWDDSGKPKREGMTILKSWESSEEDILLEFLGLTGWDESDPKPFNFVPAGINLNYELLLIYYRCKELLDVVISPTFLFQDLPSYDLKHILVLANKGKFKDSSLNNFTGKLSSGSLAGEHIKNEDWNSLEQYIKNERDGFLELYSKAVKKFPSLFPRV